MVEILLYHAAPELLSPYAEPLTQEWTAPAVMCL